MRPSPNSSESELGGDVVAQLVRAGDRAVIAALSLGDVEEDPEPLPLAPLRSASVTVKVTIPISSGIRRTVERRVIRSSNPVTPVSGRNQQ
jgi:hypothetical protein